MKFCTECGAPKPSETAKFCGECGSSFEALSAPPTVGAAAPAETQSVGFSGLDIPDVINAADLPDFSNDREHQEAVRAFMAASSGNAESRAALFTAAESGNPHAMTALGRLISADGDLDSAVSWWTQAAKFDLPEAIYYLGWAEQESGNDDAAAAYYKRAYALRSSSAAHALGNFAWLDARDQEARMYFTSAAEWGNALAMCSLGDLEAEEGNLSAAEYWLTKAADQGIPEAISLMQEHGIDYSPENASPTQSADNQADDTNEGGWKPIFRPHYSVDFQDWRSRESEEFWIFPIPEELINGTNLSSLWFIQASEDMEAKGSQSMADYCLRMAAQRGSALAMMILGQDRSELGFDDEALRWFRRVSFLLEDPRNEAWMDSEERNEFATDARRFQQMCIENGADPEAEYPNDIGFNSRGAQGLAPVYCLTCGTQKYPNVPAAQCNDSVHLVRYNFG